MSLPVDLSTIVNNGVDAVIEFIHSNKDSTLDTECMEMIANKCRDDEDARSSFVHKDILQYVCSHLTSESESVLMQACRCIVNTTYYNEDARKILLETSSKELLLLSNIIEHQPNLCNVIVSCYANLFESCEEMQELLVTEEFLKSLIIAIDRAYTSLIRMLNNISLLKVANTVFKSRFFEVFLYNLCPELASSDFSDTMEYFISIISYTEFQKVLVTQIQPIYAAYLTAIDIVKDPRFPKNVDDDDLNQTCLSIKLVFDLINSFFQYSQTAELYAEIIKPTIEYALHGDIFAENFVPAPTQSHAMEIICHIATVDKFLPSIWENHETYIKLVFETSNNSKMLEIQRHCIGILQSFSTNDAYVTSLIENGILHRMSQLFTEGNMMNQPLIYRCLSILQNFTALYEKKEIFASDDVMNMIVTTFKLMSNIVIRYSAVQALRNIFLSTSDAIQALKKHGGETALIDVCLGKDEHHEDKEQPDMRVRYEAARIVARLLTKENVGMEYFNRDQDVLDSMVLLISTDYAVLIKEGIEALLNIHKNNFKFESSFTVAASEVINMKKKAILESPEENQATNKDVLALFEEFLAIC